MPNVSKTERLMKLVSSHNEDNLSDGCSICLEIYRIMQNHQDSAFDIGHIYNDENYENHVLLIPYHHKLSKEVNMRETPH